MKLSLRWIFDHLKADPKKYSIEKIVELLNAKTCEIEDVQEISFDLKPFVLGCVTKVSRDSVTLECPELQQEVTLSTRGDIQTGSCYLIRKNGKNYEWAQLTDWFSTKEGLLPALYCDKKDLAGGWKKQIIPSDYILEVDNKSITNRPDLWGHRGFARELSVLLNVPLRDEKEFFAQLPIKTADKNYTATKEMPFTIKNSAPKACKRFSAFHVKSIEHRPSVLWMAARFTPIDARPIDLIVDATNYAMLDSGQPIHAFDANLFAKKTIEPRFAKKGEKLTLLDDTNLTLAPDDLVVTDGSKPVALAGIMGGLKSGISNTTQSLLIESANFDATTIRLSAARNKVRTDASARFEKTLDPNQNVLGIQRFIQLLRDEKVPMECSKTLVSVGKAAEPVIIKVAHSFIEKRLGAEFKKSFITKVLAGLGFEVAEKNGTYTVTVPPRRSSKDITLPEDIVEEIARVHGYDNLPEVLPKFETVPRDQSNVATVRKIKQHLAFGAHMREVENYALFDDEFITQLNWSTKGSAQLANSLSENRTTLVTNLVPHLLQNVSENMANNDELRFFEWATCWSQTGKKITEEKIVAGIFYHKKGLDFYQAKRHLDNLFAGLAMPVEWKKAKTVTQWASKHQTADLYCGKQKLGTAGIVARRLMGRLGGGHAFAFELDGKALLEYRSEKTCYKPLSKYQATSLDVSMMVPANVTVTQLKEAIGKADKNIFQVALIDEFKKAEWKNKKSITMRFWMKDPSKTLSKEVIDAGYIAVQKAVEKCGAEIR